MARHLEERVARHGHERGLPQQNGGEARRPGEHARREDGRRGDK